jgi:secretion/DNA translocation related TadE-like protein
MRAVAPPPTTSRRRQAGSATLIALALTVFLTFAGVMALDVGLLVVARARAQTAADLAALAALTPAHTGQGPGGAGAVAAANGAELVACSCGATEAVVTVRSRVGMLPAGTALTMTARARAVLPGLGREATPDTKRAGPGRGPARGVAWSSPGGIGTAKPGGAGCGAGAAAEAPGVGPGTSTTPVCILGATS